MPQKKKSKKKNQEASQVFRGNFTVPVRVNQVEEFPPGSLIETDNHWSIGEIQTAVQIGGRVWLTASIPRKQSFWGWIFGLPRQTTTIWLYESIEDKE